MIIGARRLILIGAIVAVVLTIILYPLIVKSYFDPNKVNFRLANVEVLANRVDPQSLTLTLVLNVTNMNDVTLSTSKIDYVLSVDGTTVKSDTISYEDVPINGRPALFPNIPVKVSHSIQLQYSDANDPLFKKILNENKNVKWTISGTASIDSGTTCCQTTSFSDSTQQ